VRRLGVRPGAAPSGGPASAVLAALASRGVGTNVPLPDLAREAGVSPAMAQASLSRLMNAGLLDAAPKGQVADVLVKSGPLSRRELAELRRRFEFRAAVEARQLEDVGRCASLTTCRRARLLSHFGDEAAELVAPCDGCDVCRGDGGRGGESGPPTLLGRAIHALRETVAGVLGGDREEAPRK